MKVEDKWEIDEKCNNIKKNKSYVPVHQGWKNGSHKGIESS